MVASRFVYQSDEKIRAICAVMHQAQELEQADLKCLAAKCGIAYTTLKSATTSGRFSVEVERRLAAACRLNTNHSTWVDDSVPEIIRIKAAPGKYPALDTADRFRAEISRAWGRLSVSFRTRQRQFSAFDPHMARHELSDLGQATPAGSDMHLFLTAHLEPFYHHTGIVSGFRKASLMVRIHCENGARAASRLGHPAPATLGDATLRGDGNSHLFGWAIELADDRKSVLAGEYTTRDGPLFALADHRDGTVVISRIDVNLFDRATFSTASGDELSANKQAIIQEIFKSELPAAVARNGWITISEEEIVVGRYEL